MEDVSIGNLKNEFPAIFPFLFFLPFALLARFLGLVLAFVDELLNLLFFLGRVFLVEILIVFLDQALYLFSVDFHHIIGFCFGGFHLSLAVEFVLLVALNVGVIPQPLFVFYVFVSGHAK